MNHAHPQYNEDILSYTHMETPEKKKKKIQDLSITNVPQLDAPVKIKGHILHPPFLWFKRNSRTV